MKQAKWEATLIYTTNKFLPNEPDDDSIFGQKSMNPESLGKLLISIHVCSEIVAEEYLIYR